MTHQKSSGRCWIFAVLNAIRYRDFFSFYSLLPEEIWMLISVSSLFFRLPFVKQYNLEEFEFSQAHLFFWDKVIAWFKTLHLSNVKKILNTYRWKDQIFSLILLLMLQKEEKQLTADSFHLFFRLANFKI